MPNNNNSTGWAGWVYFAGFMMIILGIFQSVAGLTALLRDEWFVVTEENLLLLDFTTWGWVHLLLGILVLVAGFSVMHGATWARIVGVVLAVISAVGNLASIELYPIWAVMMVTIDVLVIYALTVHAGELKD